MLSTEEQDLNADAIYAAMCAARGFMKSPEGQSWYADLMRERVRTPFEEWHDRVIAQSGSDGNLFPIPRFAFSDGYLDSIYPGERTSVDVGISMARTLLFGPPLLMEMMNQHSGTMEGPMGEALMQFFDDEAI